MFMDEITISVKSGNGGNGCESYLRRTDRKMIPNGGDGGRGGDVIIQADDATGSLISLKGKRIFEAEAGGFGKGKNCYGRSGTDAIIKVPCGTTVYDGARTLVLRDLVLPGDRVVAAKGSRGGYGNHSGRPATQGEEGTSLDLYLTFSIIADIFLVGLPGSGKTSLLKHLTGAHVTPAEYPFATKSPCLGTYEEPQEPVRICELPSLYAHSFEGRGMGVSFLKHLKRAKLIFFMLSVNNTFAGTLKDGFDMLVQIVKEYSNEFSEIPRIAVVNKMDLIENKKKAKSERLPKPVYWISAKTGEGVEALMKAANDLMGKK